MTTQGNTRNSQLRNRISQGSNNCQTNLLAWKGKEKSGNSKSVVTESNSMEDPELADDQAEDDLQTAVEFFEKGPKKASLNKDTILGKHLKTVENVAWKNGLAPETIDILLNVALSGKFGNAVNTRILKCMIPETVISEDSVVTAVSWLCVGKCSGNTKVLFYRWLVAMFDFIDHKKKINLLYGFFFASLQDDALCPHVCHLLYLLTKRENVKPFRVRKLLDLQAKLGMQPHLQALLSLYKFFAPTLISVSLPIRRKIYFGNSKNLWASARPAVKLRNKGAFPEPPKPILGPTKGCSLKRKWSSHSVIPALNSANREWGEKKMSLSDYLSIDRSLPLEQLQSFPELLQNIHCLELPSQMSSVLNNSLLLHYINCVKDESILLRLYYWLSQTLQEECIWYNMNNYEQEKEFINFLDIVIRVQCFLQEGFYSCEAFLYKSLPLWDGFSCQSQFLQLLAWIPFSQFSEVKPLFDHLAPLFLTSTIYFKCSVLQSLKELLQNWLLWLSVDSHEQLLTNTSLETTLGDSMSSVSELIDYIGRLSVISLRLETNNTLLLHFILDFYEKVCDIYINYDLPLLVLFPPVVLHSSLLSMDASILNQLCYIMYRYRNNLAAAKEKGILKKAKSELSLSSKICQEFNCYLTLMVHCLWLSKPFEKGMYIDPQILENTGGREYKNNLNIVHHPCLLSYAASFLLQENPEERTVDLSSIWGRKWNFYLDYLFSEGFQGLKLFIKSSIRRSAVSQTQIQTKMVNTGGMLT